MSDELVGGAGPGELPEGTGESGGSNETGRGERVSDPLGRAERFKQADGSQYPKIHNQLSPAMRRARAATIVEARLHGVNRDVLAEKFGVSEGRISQIVKWAEENGVVEEVRERMKHDLLPAAEKIYKKILTADPKDLQDPKNMQILKARELQLKAARQVAEGTGALRKHQESKTTKVEMGFGEYLQWRKQNGQQNHGEHTLLRRDTESAAGGEEQSGRDGDRDLQVHDGELVREESAGSDTSASQCSEGEDSPGDIRPGVGPENGEGEVE